MSTRHFPFRTLLLAIASLVLVIGVPAGAETCGDSEHPSGKDRCVEEGGSGTQGDAESDPDDDGRGPERTNGGADEPGGPGGVNQADQDGNNGCGNDQDFEDDNEGLCGSKPASAGGPDEVKGPELNDEDDGKIKPTIGKRPDDGRTVVKDIDPITRKPNVNEHRARLGQPVAASRSLVGMVGRAGAALAATGLPGLLLGAGALGLIGFGAAALRRARASR